MLVDTARLVALWQRFEAKSSQARLPAEEVEAMAECAFRLGVSAATPASEAIAWLKRAFRIDGANPKYAYHLARICFVHGKLDWASYWLERAYRLCPTSHRIWTHISLLQCELNVRYREFDTLEQDALRKSADAIAASVRDGKDVLDRGLVSFTPRKVRATGPHDGSDSRTDVDFQSDATDIDLDEMAVERIVNPGRCRWTGVEDLLIDRLLEDEPGPRQRDALAAALRNALERARTRRGGAAAFVILAIEWLVSGYAPAFIRRLGEKLRGSDASGRLLESTLRLFEAERSDLPTLMSRMLAHNEITPLLAAVVHQRRLLGPPWRLRSLPQAYRDAARGPSAGAQSDADELAAGLRRATKEFDVVLPDVVPDVTEQDAESPAGSAEERVQALLVQAGEIASRLEEFGSRLQKLVPASNAVWSQETLVEADQIRRVVAGVPAVCEKALAELARSAESGTSQYLARDIEKAQEAYRDLPPRLGPIRRVLKSLPELPALAAPQPPDGAPPGDTAAPIPATVLQEALDELSPLARSIRDADEKVRRCFAAAHDTFSAFQPEQRNLPPIRALMLSVRAREAEALYRLGKREEARRAWIDLVAHDRLDVRALKNLAVCDARDPDFCRSLGWWRAYLEVLYFRASRAGSVAFDSPERSRFHAEFGGAYAPRAFLDDDPKKADEFDESLVLSFLASPGRARVFVDHWLLAQWNIRLAYQSPPIVLGVSRSAKERTREEAKGLMLRWVDEVGPLVPSRVGAGFSALARRHLEEAFVACQSARRLISKYDPAYDGENRSLLTWTTAMVAFKRRIYSVVMQCRNLPQSLDSLDALGQLTRIDSIPIDTGNDMARIAARTQRLPEDWPSKMMQVMASQAVLAALRFVFPEHDAATDADGYARRRQYDRIANDWLRHPLMTEDLRGVFDDPARLKNFYTPEVAEALQNLDSAPAAQKTNAASALRRLSELYPVSSGIAIHRAMLVHGLGQVAEARSIIEAAMSRAAVSEGRQNCQKWLGQMRA